MKEILIISISLILYNLSFAEKIPIPELKSPVTDLTNTLSDTEIKGIVNKLLLFEKTEKGQIAVLIIGTTGEDNIEDFSIRLAEQWKIGSSTNNDGVIIIVAKNDRKVRIEIGYGLESTITDAEASFIIDNIITPGFKAGDFYSGVNNGIDRIIGLITGISPTIEEMSENKNTSIKSETDWSENNLVLILLIIIVLALFGPFFLIKSKLSIMIIFLLCLLGLEFLVGMVAKDLTLTWTFMLLTGILNFIPFFMNVIGTLTGKKKHWTFSGGSSSSSGWSSSSSGSWSSSSTSSSYSGGGGSFGGGGASGSW